MYCTESMTSSVAGRKGARRQEVEVRHNLCLMSSSPWKLHKSMKERVRERLRTTERHRWLGKDEGWGVVALSTLSAMCLMSSYLFLVILPFFSQPLILYEPFGMSRNMQLIIYIRNSIYVVQSDSHLLLLWNNVL